MYPHNQSSVQSSLLLELRSSFPDYKNGYSSLLHPFYATKLAVTTADFFMEAKGAAPRRYLCMKLSGRYCPRNNQPLPIQRINRFEVPPQQVISFLVSCSQWIIIPSITLCFTIQARLCLATVHQYSSACMIDGVGHRFHGYQYVTNWPYKQIYFYNTQYAYIYICIHYKQ